MRAGSPNKAAARPIKATTEVVALIGERMGYISSIRFTTRIVAGMVLL